MILNIKGPFYECLAYFFHKNQNFLNLTQHDTYLHFYSEMVQKNEKKPIKFLLSIVKTHIMLKNMRVSTKY